MHSLLCLAAIASILPAAYAVVGCKNLDGKDVDWFMAYKLPKGTKDSPQGTAFMYVDQYNTNWTLSKNNIDSDKSAIGATISQIWGKEKTLFYTMYNDDAPHTHKPEGYRGHIKGVLGFDSKTGFWIQHSMPNFPSNPTEEAYGYPDTATKFGQTLICLTMRTDDLGDIGEQLRFMMISPYAFNIPDEIDAKYPILKKIIADRESLNVRKEKVYSSKVDMKTLGGQLFTSFAKHKNFKADLWADFVAKDEGVPFAVETWSNGAAKNLVSTCKGDAQVMNIATLDINGNTFKNSMDHSKWGASGDQKKPIVCVGDINRQASQMERGGGALCIENAKVWKSWNGAIDSLKECGV